MGMLTSKIRTKPLPKIRRVICEALQTMMMDSLTVQNHQLVMNTETLKAVEQFERFLLDNVYESHPLGEIANAVDAIISRLFDTYLESPERLPERFGKREKDEPRQRIITDYIAGMTDRFCLKTYQELFGKDDSLLHSIQPVATI